MLSTLPPELLREIVESTIPHSFHSTTYRARQTTLCSLSLVSKRFRAIARPILYEVIWIESSRNSTLCSAGLGGKGKREQRGSGQKDNALIRHGVLHFDQSKPIPCLMQVLSTVTSLTLYFGLIPTSVNFQSFKRKR
ncbi:uncharacterized protein JCM6883_004211 [Sporobolomyces salmoneus]|uniref:uncharacterized protein n=1 Tax=Sporobolomyces salmoneus TaxID=183962 RepID=UPI003174D77E